MTIQELEKRHGKCCYWGRCLFGFSVRLLTSKQKVYHKLLEEIDMQELSFPLVQLTIVTSYFHASRGHYVK